MFILLPYLALYKRYKLIVIFGIMLVIITMLASFGQQIVSGWFLSVSSIAGVDGFYNFNYMLPAVSMRGISIIRIIGRYFERLVNHDVTFRVLQHLRVFTFSRLVPLSPAGLVHFRQGELLNCVVADVDTLNHLFLRVISPLTSAFVVIVVITLWLSIFDIMLALILGSIMLLALFLLPTLFYHIGKSVGENLAHLRSEYRQQLTIWLQTQAELALFGASQRHRMIMDTTELSWYKAQRKQFKIGLLSQTLIILISGASIEAMLWMASINASNDLQQQPKVLLVLFVFCALAVPEILAPVTGIFQHLGHVIASALRITQLTNQLPKVQFTKKCDQPPIYASLCLQNVTFTYDMQVQPALNDFTLNISVREHVAILGRTGCGKSTLLQLLTRAWDPHQGLININMIPLTDFSEQSLRRTVSMVTQRVHLFSATLRDNLMLANPDASDKQCIAVLNQVGLRKLLEGSGLNSWMGEGGRQLSGGELRRLAIARAILHDAPLMLLDEPTEGLDAATESQILDLLKQTMKHKTVLMVTHRLHRLADFDRIIIMDNGQIIEQGTHKELLAKQGHYYKLRQLM